MELPDWVMVSVPSEGIVMPPTPVSVVTLRSMLPDVVAMAELSVTAPPVIEIGPATETAPSTVIAAVLPDLPKT